MHEILFLAIQSNTIEYNRIQSNTIKYNRIQSNTIKYCDRKKMTCIFETTFLILYHYIPNIEMRLSNLLNRQNSFFLHYFLPIAYLSALFSTYSLPICIVIYLKSTYLLDFTERSPFQKNLKKGPCSSLFCIFGTGFQFPDIRLKPVRLTKHLVLKIVIFPLLPQFSNECLYLLKNALT